MESHGKVMEFCFQGFVGTLSACLKFRLWLENVLDKDTTLEFQLRPCFLILCLSKTAGKTHWMPPQKIKAKFFFYCGFTNRRLFEV